jgi:hypothetical protein
MQSRGQQLAAHRPHVVLVTFLCGLSHDLGITQREKDKNFLLLRRTLIYTHTLSKHKGKESQNNILMKQNFVDVSL